jgi:hypothetical protein
MLAVNFYFLIGGMLSNRMEDVLIAVIIGFILYLAISFVRSDAFEIPKISVALLFIWPLASLAGIIAMVNTLGEMSGSIANVFSLAGQMIDAQRTANAVISRDLQQEFFLSAGIISGIIFLIAQAATCVLLFVGTKPEKKAFRH